MNTYAFKIKKNEFEISLSSFSRELIENECQKFVLALFKVNNANLVNENSISPVEPITVEQDGLSVEQDEITVEQAELKVEQAELKVEQDEITVEQSELTVDKSDNNISEYADEKLENTSSKKKKFFNKLPANFATLLAQKTSEDSNNVQEKRTSELQNTYIQMKNIIDEKKLKNKTDYVLASTYCLTHYEKLMHFSEEQIKAKIAPFLKRKFNHDIILDAVAKNFIKEIPDFTGTTDEIEYELTEYGEEYFLNEL